MEYKAENVIGRGFAMQAELPGFIDENAEICHITF
jgi:hypothetical protein